MFPAKWITSSAEIVPGHTGNDNVLETEIVGHFSHIFRLMRIQLEAAADLDRTKAAALVQVSPRIIKVAVFLLQHSGRLGQRAGLANSVQVL